LWSIALGIGVVVVLGLLAERRHTAAQRRSMMLLLAACLGAAAATPLGPRLVLTPFTVGGNARQFVAEWMPSSARTPSVALTLLVLMLVAGAWIGSRSRPALWRLSVWVVALVLTLVMSRTVAVGAVLGVLLLADAAETLWSAHRGLPLSPQSPSPRPRWQAVVLTLAAVVAVGLAAPLAASRAQGVKGVPTALLSPLATLPSGTHVIADGDLTGWLLLKAPQLRPVFDIRVEVYAPQHVTGFIDALQAKPSWRSYLERTHAGAAVLESDAPLVSALTGQWGWKALAHSGGYVLLVAP
jgi:hypothetical protein